MNKGFPLVKLDMLEGLSEKAKKEVLDELTSLSPNVVCYEDVKNDNNKFEFDDNGRMVRSIDGALLWVELDSYNGNNATITGVSWFGNLGAVFPKYKATFKNGIWQLDLISIVVS